MRPLFLFVLLAATAVSQSELMLVRTTDLKAETHHVQGIDFDGQHLWVTSVDKEGKRGYLQEFVLATGAPVRTVEVTAGDRFHPGGMSAEGDALWLPVAEYRRASSSTIERRNARTLELEYQFDVADHIGCIAAGPGVLIGANWDSRDFYIWDRKGKLLRKVANPTPNAYQDIKFVDGRLVASGLLPGKNGAIDWLEYPSLNLARRITVDKTSRNVPFTSEGMAIHGDQILLLPEDSPSRLFQFTLLAAKK